jgi:hypothetical protein
MARLLRGFAILYIATLIPGVALSVVPDETASITPDCVRFALTGDDRQEFRIIVTVIGTDGLPLGGEQVDVIFDNTNCSDPGEFNPCPSQAYPVVSGTTDPVDADINFRIKLGGCCDSPGAVRIQAYPGPITLLPIYDNTGSPDTDGDEDVDIGDFTFFQQQFLDPPGEACTDYIDCDLTTGLGDFVGFQSQYNRPCAP